MIKLCNNFRSQKTPQWQDLANQNSPLFSLAAVPSAGLLSLDIISNHLFLPTIAILSLEKLQSLGATEIDNVTRPRET